MANRMNTDRKPVETPCPPGYDQIIAELRRRGLHAYYRSWAMGETIFAAAGEHSEGAIRYFDRAAYLIPVGPCR